MNAILPLLTWVIVLAEFLLNLGGMHPTDQTRDLYLAVGGVLLIALQVPLVARWVRMGRAGGRAALPVREIMLAVVRVGVAIYIFWFIHGISHEAIG